MLFSTTIVRLMQAFPIRQPLLASTRLRARRYTVQQPIPPTPTIPPVSPNPDNWSFIGENAANKKKVSLTGEQKWRLKSEAAKANLSDRPPANAYTGRSVPVKSGNVVEAYQRLQTILQRNRVRPQLRLAERHEKKGVKRRRLSRERWRKHFAHEVREKVQLVTKIRIRGA